nr:replicative DNA helicase [Gammaproteobacteria bacterium]
MNDFPPAQERDQPLEDSSPLPHSVEAEQSVLGGLMLDSNRFDGVAEQLNETDFFTASHRTIYQVMGTLVQSTQPLDIVTLAEAL